MSVSVINLHNWVKLTQTHLISRESEKNGMSQTWRERQRERERERERDVEQMRLGRIINETLILIPEQIHWHRQIGTIRQERAVDIRSCVEGTDGLYPGERKENIGTDPHESI